MPHWASTAEMFTEDRLYFCGISFRSKVVQRGEKHVLLEQLLFAYFFNALAFVLSFHVVGVMT